MDAQARILVTPNGERLVVLPEEVYGRLVEVAEDASDHAAVERFRRRLAAGEEELIPAAVVDRLLSGENRIRVWREHRGLSATALAERAGIAQAFLSQIESGKREGKIDTLRKLADALGLTIDDLVG